MSTGARKKDESVVGKAGWGSRVYLRDEDGKLV